MKELLQRTLTGIGLIVLVMGSIWLGALPFLILLLGIYLLAVRELFSLYPEPAILTKLLWVFPGITLLVLCYLVLDKQWSPILLTMVPVLWVGVSLIFGFARSATLSLLWLSIPLSSFLALGWMVTGDSYRSIIPLSVIALLWINDTFAYVSGSLLGRHPMTPSLSPGKTWEGFAGGVCFTLLGGWITFQITGVYSLFIWLLVSLIISVLGLWGDLYESGLKRKKAVKDAGNLLPGHGGILDRFDSLLFVAPGVWILLHMLKLIP